MAHECCKQRQLGLHVGTVPVPAQKSIDRKGVTKIMGAGRSAVEFENPRSLKQARQALAKACPGVALALAVTMPKQW